MILEKVFPNDISKSSNNFFINLLNIELYSI